MKTSSSKLVLSFIGLFALSILGVIGSFSLRPLEPTEYRTLTEIESYIAKLEEYVASDDGHFEDPHFLTFYRTRNPSLFGELQRKLGLWRPPAFSPAYMASLLMQQTATHHAKGLFDGKNSFVHIKAHEDTKLFVFGDIHAALHSLVRDLRALQQRGIIGDDLVVKDRNAYLVFNGNLIDRASYSIDTLIIVLSLLEKNPDKVIYIAGRHERDAFWKDYSLKRELTSRARSYSTQPIPFYKELTEFFASLPAAVYVSGQGDRRDVLRISFFEEDELSFDEKKLGIEFLSQKEPIKIYDAPKIVKTSAHVDVRAAIMAQNWRNYNRIKNGLALLEQSHGSTNWAILSAPTDVNKKFLHFHNDAFVLVQVPSNIVNASIALIHHRQGEDTTFIEDKPLNIVTGRDADNHPELASVNVGSTMSLQRGIPVVGKQIKAGMNSRVSEFNRDNRNAHSVRLFIDNDDYVPRFATRNIMEQLSDGVRYFLLPLGTPTVLATMDAINRENGVILFPQTGSLELRDKKYSRMVHFLSTYEDEARALVRAMKNDYGATKYALFYQDDVYGRGPFQAAVQELNKMGITQILALPYTRGSLSFEAAAQQIRLNQPDAIGFFSVAPAAKEFIRQIGVNELLSTNLFGLSAIGEIQFRRYLQQRGLTLLFASSVPNPINSPIPIATKYRAAMKHDNNIMDVFSFEAYIATSLFLHALKKATPHPSPDKILKVFESMKQENFEGLNLNFNPRTRSLATQIFIETDDDSEWEAHNVQ